MKLALVLSPKVSAWLEEKAAATGTDEATVVAQLLEDAARFFDSPRSNDVFERLIEEAAQNEPGQNGNGPLERLRYFREWSAQLPTRPGPPLDPGRGRIYD